MSASKRKLGYQEQDVAAGHDISDDAANRMYDSHVDYEALDRQGDTLRYSGREDHNDETQEFIPKSVKKAGIMNGHNDSRHLENDNNNRPSGLYCHICNFNRFDYGPLVLVLGLITVCILFTSYSSLYVVMDREFHVVESGRSLGRWESLSSKGNAVVTMDIVPEGYKVNIQLTKKLCPSFRHHNLMYAYHYNVSDIGILEELIEDEQVGPDEILVQLEGASLQTLIAKSENFCDKYYVIFQVPTSGQYRLKINWLRSDYSAIKLIPEYPLMNLDVVLDVLIPVQLEVYTPQPCTREATNGYWITHGNHLSSNPLVMNSECASELGEVTSYVIMNSAVGKVSSEKNCSFGVNNYHWKKTECFFPNSYINEAKSTMEVLNQTVIDVDGEGMTDNTNKDHDFIGKSILFVGDSHVRGLAELFMHIVCEYKMDDENILDAMHDNAHQVQIVNMKDKHVHHGCNDMNVGYLASMYCATEMISYFEVYDYIVVNCGHHPASGTHFSFTQFHSAVFNLFFTMKMKKIQQKSKIFWVENSAQPLRQDHWVIDKKDWRTYHRLMIFDLLAKQVIKRFSELNVGIIPNFYSTLALYDKICDCAHYPTSSKIPQLQGLLDAIRFYNGEKGKRGRLV